MRDEVLRGQVAPIAILIAGCAPSGVQPATLVISGAPPASAAPPTTTSAPAKVAPTSGTIAWESSERDARERARRSGKPMFVWARADWAAPVHQMERTTWTDPRVVAAVRAFVALRLDLTDADDPNAQLYTDRYELVAMPSTVILDARGQKVAVVSGFADADAILAALARIAE